MKQEEAKVSQTLMEYLRQFLNAGQEKQVKCLNK